MYENLNKYLPEFDEEEVRIKLAGRTPEELTDMLVYAYKEKRVIAKMADIAGNKLSRIEQVITEPSTLPTVPSADDLRRMTGNDGE